jgi:hypothetical protein
VSPVAECPRARLHTECPAGYVAWHLWAERKSRRHYQVRCPGCGLFAIWKRKPKGSARDEALLSL